MGPVPVAPGARDDVSGDPTRISHPLWRSRKRSDHRLGLIAVTILIASGATPIPTAAETARAFSGMAAHQTWSSSRGSASEDDPIVGPDPSLAGPLDAVIGVSPATTCLTVAIDGRVAFQHGSSVPVNPASNEKLLTAGAALDLLGPGYRFPTRAAATGAVVHGRLDGDLDLIGGGDPLLASSLFRALRHLPPDPVATMLDGLADRVRAAGIVHVGGRVLADETRYDTERMVATWPSRFGPDDVSGPLSALGVDGGYTVGPAGGGFRRVRSDAPALATAQLFTAILGSKGVTVDGPAAVGSAPPGARTLAFVASAPLDVIVAEMLQNSDNRTAELITKELGRTKGTGGTTAGGVAVIDGWKVLHQLAPPGSTTVDGSGLSDGNRATCDQLVTLLDTTGGRHGSIGKGLAVAGVSGTLAARFVGSPAQGRLRAKTGTLNGVSALSGFVDLPDGGTATFAYVANGGPDAEAMAAEDILGRVLSTYRKPCPRVAPSEVVAPVTAYLGELADLAAGPLAAASQTGTMMATEVFARRFRSVSDRCLAADPAASVHLSG